MKPVWNSVTFIKRAAILMLAMLGSACSSFYFYPMKELVRTPADIGLPYDDIQLTTTDNVRLHAWLLKAEQPRGLVLFLHGNAENISTHIGSVYWLPEQGYDVLLLDYRGYGQSEGEPDFPEVYLDVAAGYEWARTRAEAQKQPLFILGQSLGAAISSYYFSTLPAEDRRFNGVVLDAVFSGHGDIARDALSNNIITWPFKFIVPHLVPNEYDPKAHIAQLSPVPVLFFHSPTDNVIPYHHGETVFRHAREPKAWITGAGPHIATFNFPQYREQLLAFLAQHGSLTPTSHPQTD